MQTRDVFLCDGLRTPIGRYGGALSSVRPDELAAHVISMLMARNPKIDTALIDDVILGCVNQAGEDNRNVARMAGLLAGLPPNVPGATINRLCASGLDAVATAARAIKAGEAELMIAGGVESMSRAPFVIPKATAAFSRETSIYDTTIGWRFVNPRLQQMYGIDSMGETAENVAAEHNINRADQDAFALRSQQRAARAIASGRLAQEITSITLKDRKTEIAVTTDEHVRSDTTPESLAKLSPAFRKNGSVTAGNSSGVNDGAAAVILASEAMVKKFGLVPRARIIGAATAGVPPRVMGIGPVPATQKLLDRLKLKITDIDLIEINEAFAAQGLASLRLLGVSDDADFVNPNGGAIALGHPLGMSGTRLVLSAAIELGIRNAKRALCTMCVGVGQGMALILEAP